MREFWSITWALFLAIAVHVLMTAVVILGTMDWQPFKPPVLTGIGCIVLFFYAEEIYLLLESMVMP